MLNIAPTKANLLSAQATLEFSKKGYELLDKKRNVLIRELMSIMKRAEELQEKINSIFQEAYEALKIANITLGVNQVYEVACSIPLMEEFDILYKSVMGVEIPRIRYEKKPLEHYYSFYHTNTALDIAVTRFYEVKYLLLELAEVEDSVYKLAVEIKKTQKRANALKNIQIPRYERIVKFISEVLEEKEREDFFRLKTLKKKLKRRVKT